MKGEDGMQKFLLGAVKGCWLRIVGSKEIVGFLAWLLVSGLILGFCCSCVSPEQASQDSSEEHSSPAIVARRVAHIEGERIRLRDINRYQNRLAGCCLICQGRVLRTEPNGFFLWSSQSSSSTVAVVCDVRSLEIVEDDIVRVRGIVVPGDDETCIPGIVAYEVQIVSKG